MCAVLLAAFYTSCTPADPHVVIHRECGDPPQQPGLVAAFDTIAGERRAIMSAASYLEIKEYEAAAARWAACVQGRK